MKKTFQRIIAIVLCLAAIAGIAYALYRYFKPDYDDDFIDEFDDDFDDEFEDESL